MVEDLLDFVFDLAVGDLQRSWGGKESCLRGVMAEVAFELGPMVGRRHASLHSGNLKDVLRDLLHHDEGSLPGHEVLAMLRLDREVRGMDQDFITRKERPDLVRPRWDEVSGIGDTLILGADILTNPPELVVEVLDILTNMAGWSRNVLLRD